MLSISMLVSTLDWRGIGVKSLNLCCIISMMLDNLGCGSHCDFERLVM